MADVAVKEVDAQGRVSIPIEWRRGWKSRKLALVRRGDRIEVYPIESVRPSDLFDSIEISGKVDFVDPHSVRKALLESRDI